MCFSKVLRTYTNTLTQQYLVIIAFVGIMAEDVDCKLAHTLCLAASVTKIFTYLYKDPLLTVRGKRKPIYFTCFLLLLDPHRGANEISI